MSNELELSAKTFGLEKEQAEGITKGLETIIAERVALIDTYEGVISLEVTEGNLKTFKELRLLIRNNRTKGLKNWHKTNKAYFLAGGNFVQAIYNKEVLINESMEEKLLGAEKYFENLEIERLEKLQTKRLNLVSPYLEDAHLMDFGIMEDEFFNDYLELKKAKFEKLESEKLAEANKLKLEAEKEEERQAKIEAENVKLKAEAEAKQKQLDLEDKQRKNKEALRLGVEKKEREARDELERKEKEKQNAILLKAKQESERLKKELQIKKDAELKAKKEIDAATEQKRLEEIEKANAPIKKQLTEWVDNFEIPLPNKDNKTTLDIFSKFNAFKEWAKKEVSKIK